MEIEVLYVAGCPSVPQAMKIVAEALYAEGVSAEIRQLLVKDGKMAEDLRFMGSPTIRINGRDVLQPTDVPEAPALSCRLYAGTELTIVPLAETVRQVIVRAREAGKV